MLRRRKSCCAFVSITSTSTHFPKGKAYWKRADDGEAYGSDKQDNEIVTHGFLLSRN